MLALADWRFRPWHLYALVIATALFKVPLLRSDLTDHDNWRQTDTATIARNFIDERRILWPRINWGAPGPGYVEAEFQLYPFVVSLIYHMFGENPIYGRLLSILLGALSCLVFWKIARRYLSDPIALIAVGFLALAPVFFRFTRTFMPEATVLLFSLLAIEYFLRFLESDRWTPCLISAAAMALAILVKPTSVHLGLLFIILSLQRFGHRSFINPRLMAYAVLSLGPAVAFYVHAARIHETYGNTFGVISGGDSKWGGLNYWLSPNFYAGLAWIEIKWVAGLIGTALVVIGLLSPSSPVPRSLTIPWSAVTLLYYLIVARYAGSGMGHHYHIYAAPLAALLFASGTAVSFASRSRIARRGGRHGAPHIFVHDPLRWSHAFLALGY